MLAAFGSVAKCFVTVVELLGSGIAAKPCNTWTLTNARSKLGEEQLPRRSTHLDAILATALPQNALSLLHCFVP